MVTLKDISRHLNLSVTQVSRALNGHSDVNEQTRERVLKAAKELNYHPNAAAQKLVSGRSGMVALVLPRHPLLSADSNFLEVVSGLSHVFSSRDMQFVLHIADEDEEILAVYRKLIDRGALDGFVVVEPVDDDPRVNYLIERGVPFVVHGRARSQTNYAYYDIDNYGVGYQLTRHLLDNGHRKIAFINGLEKRTYSVARAEGYRAALEEEGLVFDESLMRYGRMNDALGMVSAVQFFAGGSSGPTAVICGNMLVARGVYSTLRSLGLSIPDDVSVVAHDDVLPEVRGAPFYPALTVTKAALSNSWAPMGSYLIGAINGEPMESLQEVADVEFLEHASVGPAKR